MSDVLERYKAAVEARDFDELGALRHPEYTCTYPQSGEVFRGHENWVAAHRDYVSRFDEAGIMVDSVKGGERSTHVARTAQPTLAFTPTMIQISDSRDLAVLEGKGTWPDGKVYHWVMILELRDGLVWRETDYYPEPFEAPLWRAEFTEGDAPDAG